MLYDVFIVFAGKNKQDSSLLVDVEDENENMITADMKVID